MLKLRFYVVNDNNTTELRVKGLAALQCITSIEIHFFCMEKMFIYEVKKRSLRSRFVQSVGNFLNL